MFGILLALQAAAPTAPAPLPAHDALRYDITLVPADTGGHLLGEVETTWRLISPDPVGVLLDSSMRVVRVMVDGRPNTRVSRTMYGRSDQDVVVPHQKNAGDSITTRIRYHGTARASATVGANRRGERIFVAHGTGEGPRSWLPVPERTEADRAIPAFRIQAPVAQRAIANGALTKVDTLPYGDAVWQYQMDVPVPVGSFAGASGPYHVRSLMPDSCERCPSVDLWRYRAAPVAEGWARAWQVVDAVAGKAGPYPYGRLTHVEAPVPEVLATPGLVLHPEGTLEGAGPADGVLAGATARQWFGLALSPADTTDRWLVAGLATYIGSLWRDPSGRSAERLATEGPGADGARGARAMHRLRRAVGDSAFFGGLARFTRTHLHQTVTRADFVRAMSESAGRDLDRELRKALDREG